MADKMTAEQFARNYVRAMSEGVEPEALPFAGQVINFYGHTGQEHTESGAVRAAYTAQMGRILPALLDDFAIRDVAIDVVSDAVVFVRLTITGILPDGERVAGAQCTRFELVDGRVARVDGYIDQGRHAALGAATRAMQERGQAVFSMLTTTVTGD